MFCINRKKGSYFEMIHMFNRAGMNLALDVGSGAVHILDKNAFTMLSTLSKSELQSGTGDERLAQILPGVAPAQAAQIYGELAKLTQDGLLYADDTYAEFGAQLDEDAPIKAMCLHMAHDCNLRCKYCFASTGGFGGTRKLMDLETARAAIDRLLQLSGNRRNLEVDFFGGEPLMNFDVLRETVAYARTQEKTHGKNFRFTVTTNGLNLNDEIIDFINREMSNVVLSIDGRKQVNDHMRPTINGKGSYDAIVPKFQQLVAGRGDKEYYVRGTYTRYNLDFDKDILQLYDLGFTQISVEPVVGPETDDYSIRQQDIPQIEQSYTRLMQELVARRKNKQNDFNFFHFMVDLDNGPCAIKRLKGCGSGNEYVAVTPDGEIYPCHQFVGQPDFIMGSAADGIWNRQLKQDFARANILHKPECGSCWAKLFCSGGCNANNHAFNGSIYTPYRLACELEKIRLECSIAIQAALA